MCWVPVPAKEFFDAANPVGKEMTFSGSTFTVVGVYREKDPTPQWSMDNIIVIPYSASRYLPQQGSMSEFTVKAADSGSIKKVITQLKGQFSSWNDTGKGHFDCYSDQQWQDSSNQQALMMSLVLGAIAGISLLVGGIGIMNIMLVTVTERTREIRYSPRHWRRAQIDCCGEFFQIEAAMICGMGGIIGIAIGFLGTAIASKLIVHEVLLPSRFTTIGAFLFSVVLGILFGMFPAIKASKLQPVVALRAE